MTRDAQAERLIRYYEDLNRDLRTVLDALYEADPWIPADEFKDVFVQCELGDLYHFLFEPDPASEVTP